MSAVIELQQAGVRAGAREVLHQISASIRGGELCMLVGPNGAGKSSLLAALAADLPLHCGRRTTPRWPPRDARWLARHLAVLPQHSQLSFAFTAAEVVALARTPHASGALRDAAIVQAALKAMDVAELGDALYTRLSGGERQRVQLARVLAQVWEAEDDAPRLLLLDEPTAALDLAHQRQLMRLLKARVEQAGDGFGVVAVVHDLNLAAAYADRVLCLDHGKLVAHGPAHEVLNAQRVAEVFGCEVDVMTHPVSGRTVLVYAD